MILDKQIRSMIVLKLQSDDDITSVVETNNILNFPVKKIDMKNTPAISVFTLSGNDNSNSNAVLTDMDTIVYLEVTGTDADTVDDIENLIDICLVDDSTVSDDYQGIEGLYSPIYKSNQTGMEDDGNKIRVVKSTTFKFRSKTMKGATSDYDVLSQINGDLIFEKDSEGNDIPDSQLNNEIEVTQ